MSRLRPFLTVLAAAAAIAAGAAGFAGAASIEDALRGGLAVSDAPGLLGPIQESGRSGWECKPEIAAAATTAAQGDLPVVPRR